MGNNTKQGPQPKQAVPESQFQNRESTVSVRSDRVSQSAYTEMPKFENEQPKTSSFWSAALLALVVAGAGVGYMVKQSSQRSPDSVPLTAVAQKKQILYFSAADVDHKKTEEVKKELAEGKTPEALKEASPQIVEQVKKGNMDFYTIRIFDSAYEDGDVVEISINGEPFGFISMMNAGTTITIPLMPNQAQSVSVKAIHDGGGGVTFGGETSVGEVMFKNMEIGEVNTFGVGFK